jgi:hypothetical protein
MNQARIKKRQKAKPSEEVWRLIEEYANGLREIIKRYRRYP